MQATIEDTTALTTTAVVRELASVIRQEEALEAKELAGDRTCGAALDALLARRRALEAVLASMQPGCAADALAFAAIAADRIDELRQGEVADSQAFLDEAFAFISRGLRFLEAGMPA